MAMSASLRNDSPLSCEKTSFAELVLRNAAILSGFLKQLRRTPVGSLIADLSVLGNRRKDGVQFLQCLSPFDFGFPLLHIIRDPPKQFIRFYGGQISWETCFQGGIGFSPAFPVFP